MYAKEEGVDNMALASFVINPEAGPMTGDEIIGAINAGISSTITAPDAVNGGAVVAATVTNTELDSTAAKDNLDALADVDRHYVQTNPVSGEFPVVSVDRSAAGLLEVDYDDVAIP